MKGNQLVLGFALLSLVFLSAISWQEQSAIAQSAKNTAESPARAKQAPERSKISPLKLFSARRQPYSRNSE